jgi:tetratricopeptide (TPR) repeat protein
MRAHLCEEHSSVLAHWWREGIRARTLICLDAHLDLQFVGAQRMRRLEECASAEAVAALEKPHDLLPDGEFAYSLENFLYPAARLGLVRRLVWVAPPHVRAGYSQKAVEQLRQMEGVGADDLESFRRVGGRIEGRLLGLDLTVCDLGELERVALPGDSLIDFDVDYFTAVPGDRAWIDPREVVTALRQVPHERRFVTISRSVGSGFTPLRQRFLGDYLAALWEERTEESEHYARLFALERQLDAASVPALEVEARRYPECAATWHLLGLAHGDREQGARCQARAAALSPAYAPSLLRAACEIRHRGLRTDRAFVMRLERDLPGVPEKERGVALAALGLLWCGFGDLDRALDCHQRAAAALGSQSDLAIQLAMLFLRAGKAADAVALLESALDDDKSRIAAHAYLGYALGRSGRLEEARRHLEEAHRAAPCWPEPLEALRELYERLGEERLARQVAARLADEQARQDSLRRRLAW